MFRFGFKKKWKGNKESNDREQPPTANGITLLTFRALDNEFTPRTPVVENQIPRRPRVKRNVLEVFRQSYPNFPAAQSNPVVETVPFETVQPRKEFVPDVQEKSTLIFMTEDHGDDRQTVDQEEDLEEVNLGAAFQQRHMISSTDQENELDDIYSARTEEQHSDKNSIEDRETVELEDEDNFRVHVVQHINDNMSMVSYQSGDTILDSVMQDERPAFKFDDYYNFGETQDDAEIQSQTEDANDVNPTNKLEDEVARDEEEDKIEPVEKRVMFDVSDNDEEKEKRPRRKIKPEIIHTPIRKETLEDVKMKPGYSLQASALFFNATEDDEGETSA